MDRRRKKLNMLAAANRQYNSKLILGEAIVNESSKIGLFKNEEGRCKRRSTCKGKVGNRLLLFSSRLKHKREKQRKHRVTGKEKGTRSRVGKNSDAPSNVGS